MATQGGIADGLLYQLAEDIETSEQTEAFGRTLGFKAAAINRYTDTNNKGDRVTCKGTRDMLFDWRQTVEPCDQHLRLKQALTDAKLVMLADTHLKGTRSVLDSNSEKISESLTVQQCREKLKKKYLDSLCKIQMKPWDHSDYAEFDNMHTVVTMVTKDAHGNDTKKKEILQDSVGEIFSMKVNGRLPARILISAPAGRGKTTAVAKMAYDWVHREKGSALEHLPLLFVVKFRNTSQLTSIGEAIKSQLLSDVDDLTPEGLESFIRKHQGICHIILDGLDEYAGISSSQGSSGSNIVRVIRSEEFTECRVLVTTRPHLEYFFDQAELSWVYTKMWIEGFSQESSREYIGKFFASNSNPDSGHDLKVYLDDQPLINELVKTPLFCLMVCHLWSECLLKKCTTTQTELLDNVNIFLTHHANARSKSRVITPKNLRKIISQVGQVALTGLLDDAKKLIFTPHDFRRVPAILDRACEIGIVSQSTVPITGLPQPNETTSNTIEFYHKLAQEHSAGKYLAAKTNKYMLQLKISKLDRLLQKIKANIGDYENLIRFAAGTDNRLCIRIMEALLSNSCLDESERYRILLDCSSERRGTEGNVSSLVHRCVYAQSIVLKSPTVYTVVGMENLPKQLKRQVRTVQFERSTLTTDVMSCLWSCLASFSILDTLNISDSSFSFPPSPPVLPSVTKLLAERLTSQSYEGLLSSLPGLKEVDITIDDAERDLPRITAGLRRIGGQQLTRFKLKAPSSGVKCLDEEGLVELVESLTYLKASDVLHLQFGSLDGGCFEYDIQSGVQVKKCRISTEITARMWSCLRSFTLLNHLAISESSLSFPLSPLELPSVTNLSVERVTSQSYEGLLSSLPGLKDIDITINDAERDIPQITAVLRRTGRQQLTHITITAPSSLPSEKKSVSRETMRGLNLLIREQTKNLQRLGLSGVKCVDEEDLVELVESSTYLKALDSLHLRFLDGECFKHDIKSGVQVKKCRKSIEKTTRMWSVLQVKKCRISTEITARMWSCLRSFTLLNHLAISESSLSFPLSPLELPSVTNLSVERVTSQSYEGLLSSLPGLKDIDITINDAERDIPQITAGLRRTGRQQLMHITITAPSSLPSEKKSVSRETMRGLGLLIREQTKNLQRLGLSGIKCLDEEGLVYLIECCRRVMTMSDVWLDHCETIKGGKLVSHLKGLHTLQGDLSVRVYNHGGLGQNISYSIITSDEFQR